MKFADSTSACTGQAYLTWVAVGVAFGSSKLLVFCQCLVLMFRVFSGVRRSDLAHEFLVTGGARFVGVAS